MPPDRIKAYFGFAGDQVCLAGCGEGPRFGTFPKHFLAADLMNSPHWIRVLRPPTEDEKVTRGIHYEPLGPQWRPKTIILNRKGVEPFVCVGMDTIGGTASLPTESITVLLTEHTFQVEERECADLSKVRRPGTPRIPPRANRRPPRARPRPLCPPRARPPRARP